MNEINTLKKYLSEMAQIINAAPGEVFTNKESETFHIMERRLNDGDLKEQLGVYNSIFTKQADVDVSDITASTIAYIKIKVLLEDGETNFNPKSKRALIVACNEFINRTTNIIKLSRTNAVTSEDEQKERIERTIEKNEELIKVLEATVAMIERSIERQPNEVELEESEYDFADKSEEEELPLKPRKSVGEAIGKILNAPREAKAVDERLRAEEKKEASTCCVEIPFYEKVLIATEIMPCKDFSCFSLLKRKENVYFGLTKNIKANTYDNSDQSLIELTEITEDFLQFMTTDLLSGEYELREFSAAEKLGMLMYFNFVSAVFEKQIGVMLSVSEYLEFKRYYNRLVCRVFGLDDVKNRAYYRALPVAEKYMAMMNSYNMTFSESKRQLVENLIGNNTAAMVENLRLIVSHHIVDEEAKADMELLIEQIIYFGDENHFKTKDLSALPQMETPAFPFSFVPQIPMYQPGQPLIGNLYFTIQCLNEEKEVIDEAIFSPANMNQAVRDYEERNAFSKRIGLVQNGQFLPILSSEK